MVKGAGDKTVTLSMIALGHCVPAMFAVFLVTPPAAEAIPYMIASIMVHWCYFYLLNVGYSTGDLSLIYPISRGLAPVLVALMAQIFIGERLSVWAWAGILCVSAGILMISRGVWSGGLSRAGVFAACGIGAIVAFYTVVDGVGIRVSGSVSGYIAWLFLAKILIVIFVFGTRFPRVRATPPKVLALGFVGGLVSGLAYALVLYAKSIAPLGIVSALRETSVIFAALLGVIWFGEGPRLRRVLAALVVGAGVAVIGLFGAAA